MNLPCSKEENNKCLGYVPALLPAVHTEITETLLVIFGDSPEPLEAPMRFVKISCESYKAHPGQMSSLPSTATRGREFQVLTDRTSLLTSPCLVISTCWKSSIKSDLYNIYIYSIV